MKGTGLDRGDAFGDELRPAVDQPRDVGAVGLGLARDLVVVGLVGLAEGASRLWMDEGAREPADEVARLMADFAWRGLRAIRDT